MKATAKSRPQSEGHTQTISSPSLTMNIKHILLATDLSAESQRAFPFVEALAITCGARISLVHCVQHLTNGNQQSHLETPVVPPDYESVTKSAEDALKQQAADFDSSLKVSVQLLSGSDVPACLADFAKTNQVDVIALSTHGRSGFKRLALGSVAEGVLRVSSTPVLCFPKSE